MLLPRLLWRTSPPVLAGVFGLAVVAAVLDRAAVFALGRIAGVHADGDWLWPAAIAVVSVLGALAAGRYAFSIGLRLAERACDSFLLGIIQRVADAEYRDLELLGEAAIQDALTGEAAVLVDSAFACILVLPAAATLLLTLLWFAFNVPEILLIIVAVIGCGLPAMRYLLRQATRCDATAEAAALRFFDSAARTTAGALSLKQNARQSRDFLRSELGPNIDAASVAGALAGRSHTTFDAFRVWLNLIVITAILALVPADATDGVWLMALLLVIATKNPADRLSASLPSILRAGGAIARLRALVDRLPGAPPAATRARPFETIEMRAVTYVYRDAEGAELSRFGPVDFHLRRGEIVALTGGNGSGKTTLSRLLCGLYRPETGAVLIDGVAAAPAQMRAMFGAVFADFHLFARLYGKARANPARVAALLQDYELDHVVSLRDDAFSTTDLSTGQRKRLGMVVAEMDDRPVRLYDEWTAEQEPRYRERFYSTILREQQARGCTIVVISHDDALFGLADRVVRMEEGRVLPDRVTETAA